MLMQSRTSLKAQIASIFYVSAQRHKSHYDVLGITPKATQNDIKSAYYKLSKIHHPDKSNDEESAKKFRSITEAYEVLGNVKLKKLYDKGLIVGRENTTRVDYHPEPDPTDPTLRFYKSRAARNVVPTMDGKTPIYDFDTWSQKHYGDLFTKSQYNKDLIQKRRAKKLDDQISARQEFIIISVFSIVGLFLFLVAYGTTDYDHDTIDRNKKEDATSETIRNKS